MIRKSLGFISKTIVALFIVLSLIYTPGNAAFANDNPAAAIPTRLVIPSINLDSAVVPVGWQPLEIDGQAYGRWLVDDNLVGWHNLSAPLGQVGNTVLNGHSNIRGQIFRDLDQIEVQDRIISFFNHQEYHYVVTDIFLVQEKDVSLEQRIENAKLIMPTSDNRLTLITCAEAGATHRLIIIARPVEE